jgi:hypothetical protein
VITAIIQPSYFPWRGYFSFLKSVDCFIFLDDVQYTNRDWRNRNKFEIDGRSEWLTVPVAKGSTSLEIKDVSIDESTDWRRLHLKTFQRNYSKAPFFEEAHDLFNSISLHPVSSISDLTCYTTILISEYLGIECDFLRSSILEVDGTSSLRLMNICLKISATEYLSGPSAKSYLDVNMFEDSGIGVQFQEYEYDPYPRSARPWLETLSVLDLIAFNGRKSIDFI